MTFLYDSLKKCETKAWERFKVNSKPNEWWQEFHEFADNDVCEWIGGIRNVRSNWFDATMKWVYISDRIMNVKDAGWVVVCKEMREIETKKNNLTQSFNFK